MSAGAGWRRGPAAVAGMGRRQVLGLGTAALALAAAGTRAQHTGHGGAPASAAGGAPASAAGGAAPRARRPALGMGAALAPDGQLWVVHADAAGTALSLARHDGRRWAEPRRLDLAGDAVAADGENHPKIAFGLQGAVVVSYTQPLAKPYTGRVRVLHSADGGATFSAPHTVHHDRQQIGHRFESLAFDGQGRLHVVWIDKRDQEAAKGEGRPYAGAALYHAVSHDGGASFAAETKLADHSCECCRIALAVDAQGRVAALWRHVWPVNLRDHGFARLDSAAPVAPQRATHDGWVVAGCPHHGPGLAPRADGGWQAVWFGQRDGVAGVRVGRLDAQGRPLGEARLLPDAAAEHASIASAGERVAVVWRSHDGWAWRWRAWLSDDGGRQFKPRELGSSLGDSDHPRLVGDGRRLHALWRTTDQGVLHAVL